MTTTMLLSGGIGLVITILILTFHRPLLAVLAVKNCEASMPYVDIYLTYKNGDLNIRMMDNSRPFDPRLLAGVVDETDPCANIGLRIVKGIFRLRNGVWSKLGQLNVT